jgi:tetratricopeptide (TPR) repeat protein
MFHTAIKEKITGHQTEAETMFKAVLDIDPNHDPSMYELARIYQNQDRVGDAILLMEKAIQLNSYNVWYQLFLADLYKNTGDFEKVAGIFQNLVKANPENIEYQFNLALAYIIMGDYKQAIEVYNNIEKFVGITEEISLKKQTIYLSMNKPDKALQEIEILSEKYPQNSRYLQILAESYLELGQNEKALKTYQKIAEIDPENPYIHISLSDFYRKNNNENKAFEELRLGFANPQLDVDSKIQILLSYYTLDQFYNEKKDETVELATILVETHPGDVKAMSIYGDLLYRTGSLEKALNVFNLLLESDSSSYAVWEQKMFIENELTLTEKLIETSKNRTFPHATITLSFQRIRQLSEEKLRNCPEISRNRIKPGG